MLVSVRQIDGKTVAFVPALARPASASLLAQMFPEAPKTLKARHPEELVMKAPEPSLPRCETCKNHFCPREAGHKYCKRCVREHNKARLDALVKPSPKPVRPPPRINHRLEDERLRVSLIDQYHANHLPDGVTLTLNGSQVVLVAEVVRGGVKMKRSFTFVDQAIKARLEQGKVERLRMADAQARAAVAASRAAAAARKKEAEANPSPKKDKSGKKGDKDKSKRK
jgi:hypothetical protein